MFFRLTFERQPTIGAIYAGFNISSMLMSMLMIITLVDDINYYKYYLYYLLLIYIRNSMNGKVK